MKKISAAYAVIVVALLHVGAAVAANPPRGSYLRSCSNVSFDGRTLIATCLTRAGTPVTTTLQFANRCRRDIANINGVLLCR
jgi:hypothetical protein